MEIKKIVLGPLATNCYILTDELTGDIAIIDPAYPSELLLDIIKGKEDKVKYILLTHRHVDHLLGAKELKDMTTAKIVIHEFDEGGLSDADISLYNSISSLYSLPQPNLSADILLKDNDKITLGGLEIKVMHTPGHTKGGVCFIAENVIFSGDTLFYENIGRLDFPTGSFEDMKKSLQRLCSLTGDFSVMPGHEAETSLQHERLNNPYL